MCIAQKEVIVLLLHVISHSLNFSWLTLTQVAIKRLNWSWFNADVFSCALLHFTFRVKFIFPVLVIITRVIKWIRIDFKKRTPQLLLKLVFIWCSLRTLTRTRTRTWGQGLGQGLGSSTTAALTSLYLFSSRDWFTFCSRVFMYFFVNISSIFSQPAKLNFWFPEHFSMSIYVSCGILKIPGYQCRGVVIVVLHHYMQQPWRARWGNKVIEQGRTICSTLTAGDWALSAYISKPVYLVLRDYQ